MSAASHVRLDERDNAGKITLPPPDWVGPKATNATLEIDPPSPLERRVLETGVQATQGMLRGELLAAHASGDVERQRAAAARFARWLAAQGRNWDEALRYGRIALELGEEESLRHELSGWLEGLGEAAAAAVVLEPLCTTGTRDPVEAVRLLVHTGVLEARAGNARAAAGSFAHAARLDPGEGLASELLGTLGSWAPGAVTPSEAAESYVEAAERRLSGRALDAQMEDLLRAFDVDPTSSVAVAALASALTERGRPLGADEVWRAHAGALRPTDEKRSRAVHARRRLQARAAGDLSRALGAALDEGLDTVFGSEVGDFMDDLLLRAGLLEPLVARLEIRAESAPRATQAALFEEIARLHAGPLANADRAAAARIVALAADPTREDALAALRVHATETRDATELVEALIRAVQAPEDAVSSTVRLSAARALAIIADEALADPMLAAWALDAAGDAHPEGEVTGRAARAEALHAAESECARLKRALLGAEGDERADVLRALAGLLRSCPGEGALNGQVLAELVERVPAERRWYTEALRLASRRRDHQELVRLSRAAREKGGPIQDLVDAAAIEAGARRAMGDLSGANETTRTLVTKAPDDPRALAVAWMNAALAGDRETRSAAVEHLARFAGASVRAVLYAVAAETRSLIGDREAPRRLAERACHTDPSSARAVGTLADAAVGAHDRTAASALERGIHFLFARSNWCRALAEALDAMGEASYAVGWTQRLVALRPGDRKAMAALLERVARTRDGARLAEALLWVLSQPQPASALTELVVTPLRDLIAIDAERALFVARRALEAFGARPAVLREAMLAAAEAANEPTFAVAVLERAVAVEDVRTRGTLFAALREQQQRMGDADGEARTLLAITRSAPDESTFTALEALGQVALSPDGELCRLEALARLVTPLDGQVREFPAGAESWRRLAVAQWDFADDRSGAEQSLWRAAKLDAQRGLSTFVFDLAQLGGTAYALEAVARRIHGETSDTRAALMSAQAARVALSLAEPSRAFDFATAALARNPKLSEALQVAESSATASHRAVELTRVYDDLTARALGRFARRAVNYRAARFFEAHSDDGLALKHAARAFQAVPSEGAALLLLIRTAERAGDRSQAVSAMVQVADGARDKGTRFGWLLRAANVAGSDEQGLALRVDVLLHALTVSRDPRASVALQKAAEDLLRSAPDERASLELRLGRASKTVTAKADGPEGARLAVSFARMALDLFDDALWGSQALASAIAADADLEDYETLLPYAPILARDGDVEALFALVVRPYTNVGVAAFRLLARIAEVRNEGPRAADLWSRAAAREPEDSLVVRTADAALRAHGDDALWARLRKAVPDDERARMFRTYANERLRDGALDEALRALTRAVELADPDERPEIEAELRAAYETSGRAGELEQRALAAASDEAAATQARVSQWLELARIREARGDLVEAVDAIRTATLLDESLVETWQELERVAVSAGRDDARMEALRELAERLPQPAQTDALKRLARAYEERDDFKEAEATWRHVAATNPDDEEADHALEGLISALRNYADLAHHLERRTARLAKAQGSREALRAVRLRRAAILEQRLGRTRDACAELSLVLDESPDNVSALSYLADLHERLGEFAKAAPIWHRVAMLSRDAATQSELELRAGRASLQASDLRSALASAKDVLGRESGRRDAIELRALAARALQDDNELGDALEDLATATVDDPRVCSAALMDAAYAALRGGRTHAALERARRAAAIAPERATTHILARTLEYRTRGVGTVDEARMTLAELARVTEEPTNEEAAALAFLRAEALDIVPEEGSGLVVLRQCEDARGQHPLLSVGIAERLVALGDFKNALLGFEAALAGDLGDLRDRGKVALAAAETAVRAGQEEAALALLQDAAETTTSRTTALLRAAQLVLSRGDGARARGILSELAASAEGDDRARAFAQLARLERSSNDAGDRERASATFERALASASPGGPLATQLALEREALDPPDVQSWRVRMLEAPSFALEGPPSMRRPAEPDMGARAPSYPPIRTLSSRPPPLPTPPPPAMPVVPVISGQPLSVPELESALAAGATREERSHARLALARAYLDRGMKDAAEACLAAGLEEGGLEEGDVLASLHQSAGRLRDVVDVRRRQVALTPGDFPRLEALRTAASADRNLPYARAVDHVVRVLDTTGSPLVPPPLAAQTPLEGFLSFLTRAQGDRVAQSLALVWEDGHMTWGKDASAELQGALPAATSSPDVARLYETAIALLGLPRVPLFVRPSEEPHAPAVCLTWPPAAILMGKLEHETPEVRFALGQALALTLPTNVITLGLDEVHARHAFRAVMGAFGPPESSRAMNKESGRLAEALWHVLPPRTQRRLQTLLGPVHLDDFDAAPGRSWQCAHRIGMFVAGDFRTAVRVVLAERAAALGTEPPSLYGADWMALCHENPQVADLLQLAVSPEYAEARWQGPVHSTGGGGTAP